MINSHLQSDIDFYTEEAMKIGSPILEIACGTGRITIPLAKQGLKVVGLDISPSMLSEAKKKSQKANLEIEWIQGDCRYFDLNMKFKLIFIPFNSLQHLHDLHSLELFLRQVKKHLEPDGQFILDVFNPDLEILSRGRERYKALDFIDPKTQQNATIEEVTSYNEATQVNNVVWYYSLGNAKDHRIDKLDLRCFFPQELEALVKYNGFQIVNKYGNFFRDAFEAKSPKQILRMKAK